MLQTHQTKTQLYTWIKGWRRWLGGKQMLSLKTH